MENKIDEFEKALIDVRKAHRLIFRYQEKMLDLAYYIKSRLDFPDFIGKKHFSDPIGSRRKGVGMQRIWHNMWAWDFIYSYVYEYYLGIINLGKYDCQLSIIQYSDTGFFDQSDEEVIPIDIQDYLNEENSISKILFILEAVPKTHKNWKWNSNEFIQNRIYASASHSHEVLELKNSKLISYSFPLSRFVDENSTNETLKEFCTYCEKNGIIGLGIV